MTELFDRFSSKENLKRAYEYIKNELKYSSLPTDPLIFPFIQTIEEHDVEFFSALEKLIQNDLYKPQKPLYLYIPKGNLKIRPVVVMSIIDKIVYQSALNQEVLGLKIDVKWTALSRQ